MTNESRAWSAWVIRTNGARPLTSTAEPTAFRGDRIVAGRPVDVYRVGLRVAGRTADCRGQVDIETGQIRSGHIVDGHGVGPASGPCVDRLDVVEIHHDAALCPGEPDPATAWSGGHVLVGPEPVEDQRVGAARALDDIGAVALIPDEGVIARAEECRVGASVAVDDVVAPSADEDLRAGSTVERVVTVLAVVCASPRSS